MEIVLPKQKRAATTKSPRILIVYSPPKVGKTTLMAGLDNNLIIDLERGTDYFDVLSIQINTYQELYALCEKIKAEGKPYRYITCDTVTKLEDLALPLALKLYQQTAMGKTFNGDILSLPNGAGYGYLRKAVEMLIDMMAGACERLILVGHVKEKMTEFQGKEVSVKEIALTGKISSITCANADAIGLLYRKGNQCILTFETSNEIVCGARPFHLRNKALVVSEQDPTTGETTTFWESIYID